MSASWEIFNNMEGDIWSFQHLAQWSPPLPVPLASLLWSQRNLGSRNGVVPSLCLGHRNQRRLESRSCCFQLCGMVLRQTAALSDVLRHCEAQESLSLLSQRKGKGDVYYNPFPLHLPLQGLKASTSIQWRQVISALAFWSLGMSPHLSCLAIFFRGFSEVTICFLSLFFTLTLLRLEAINNSIVFKVLDVSEVNPLRQELCQAVLAHCSVSVVMKIFVCSVWFTQSLRQITLRYSLQKL